MYIPGLAPTIHCDKFDGVSALGKGAAKAPGCAGASAKNKNKKEINSLMKKETR